MIDTMINTRTATHKPIPTISLPNEKSPQPKLRLVITIFVTVFVVILIIFDQFLNLWLLQIYWILFILGLLISLLLFWRVFLWNDVHSVKGKPTFLEKWSDEIGWPLMILAFTLQFIFPQIRPLLLGAILAATWFLVIWHRLKNSNQS